MGKKRHAKVYVISDDSLRQLFNPEEEMEYTLALEAVRAKCFSSANLTSVTSDDKGPDWEMNNALTSAMIKTCDVVAVIGENITPSMEKEIFLASELGKTICVSKSLRKLVEHMNVHISANTLASICKKVLQN